MRTIVSTAIVIQFLVPTAPAEAQQVANGDFEAGTMSFWTTSAGDQSGTVAVVDSITVGLTLPSGTHAGAMQTGGGFLGIAWAESDPLVATRTALEVFYYQEHGIPLKVTVQEASTDGDSETFYLFGDR